MNCELLGIIVALQSTDITAEQTLSAFDSLPLFNYENGNPVAKKTAEDLNLRSLLAKEKSFSEIDTREFLILAMSHLHVSYPALLPLLKKMHQIIESKRDEFEVENIELLLENVGNVLLSAKDEVVANHCAQILLLLIKEQNVHTYIQIETVLIMMDSISRYSQGTNRLSTHIVNILLEALVELCETNTLQIISDAYSLVINARKFSATLVRVASIATVDTALCLNLLVELDNIFGKDFFFSITDECLHWLKSEKKQVLMLAAEILGNIANNTADESRETLIMKVFKVLCSNTLKPSKTRAENSLKILIQLMDEFQMMYFIESIIRKDNPSLEQIQQHFENISTSARRELELEITNLM